MGHRAGEEVVHCCLRKIEDRGVELALGRGVRVPRAPRRADVQDRLRTSELVTEGPDFERQRDDALLEAILRSEGPMRK